MNGSKIFINIPSARSMFNVLLPMKIHACLLYVQFFVRYDKLKISEGSVN